MLTPVSSSPLRIAAGIGAAPRYFGSNEGWTFNAPCGASRSARRFNSSPYATTTSRSGATASMTSSASSDRSDSGWNRRRPRLRAASAIGGAVSRRPRPAGRLGCVTTSSTEKRSSFASACNDGTANAGEPRNTTRKVNAQLPAPRRGPSRSAPRSRRRGRRSHRTWRIGNHARHMHSRRTSSATPTGRPDRDQSCCR